MIIRIATDADLDVLQASADARALKFVCSASSAPYPPRHLLQKLSDGELQNVYAAFEDDGTPVMYVVVIVAQRESVWFCACEAFDKQPQVVDAVYNYIREDLGEVWGHVENPELIDLFVKANKDRGGLVVEGNTLRFT